MPKEFIIYTDGSCRNNPGRGGWAYIIFNPETNESLEGSGGFKYTTNNRMEMISIIKALDNFTTPATLKIHSDSEYICNAFNKKWLDSWRKRNWIKSDKQPVKNIDLWQLMLKKLAPHTYSFIWVKGHAGQPQNERCDQLAQAAADAKDLQQDPGFSAG